MAGYNNSKHAIAIVNGATRIDSVKLVGVGCVNWFATGRMRHLLNKYGFWNAWAKLKNILAENPQSDYYEETRYITDYLVTQGVEARTLSGICNRLSIHFLQLRSVNEDLWLEWLKANEVDLLIYSGGGILSKKTLEALRIGALNSHGGPLPFFRGMNGLEWSLAYGVQPEITVHIIDRGIDTGPILKRELLNIEDGDNISRLRGKSVVKEVECLIAVIQNFEEYYKNQQIQEKEDGLQFFVMHQYLNELLDRKLNAGWRPRILAKNFHFPRK